MRASLHLLGLALLAACSGGRTALSTPDAGDWTVPDAAGANATTVAPLRCTLGVQPSAPDPRELAQGALCRFDGTATRPGAIVLAAIDGDALYGIDARGVARMVHRFAEGLPFAAEPGRAVLTAHGEHIAGAMTSIETPPRREGGAWPSSGCSRGATAWCSTARWRFSRTSREATSCASRATSAGCSRGGGGRASVSGWTSRRPTARS